MANFWLIALVIIVLYKILDRLIRLFYLGGHSNRYILVTGCDVGFGNLLTKQLDKLGCHVFAGCFTKEGKEELIKECSKNVVPLNLDVTDPKSVRHAYDTIKAALPKGKGLWGVVNNAGIAGCCAPQEWLTLDDYREVADVNLYGAIDVSMVFLPLVKLERGRIVQMSSSFGRHSTAVASPYSLSKYAVESFGDGLRRGMRPFGVKVILIEPGFYKTRIAQMKNTTPGTRKAWNRASQQIKDEYGEEYYKCFMEKGLKTFEEMCCERLHEVVNAMTHGLLGTFPRARYVVGIDANYLMWTVQMLPEWLGDWFLEKTSGLVPPAGAISGNRNRKTD